MGLLKKLVPAIIKISLILIFELVVIGVIIQFIPYGKQGVNPPVIREPQWNSPLTQGLAQRSCYNCHSNTTIWPKSKTAPFSWFNEIDVYKARTVLNFSEWGTAYSVIPGAASLIDNAIYSNKMPPAKYLSSHPEAKMTPMDKDNFVQGMYLTMGGN